MHTIAKIKDIQLFYNLKSKTPIHRLGGLKKLKMESKNTQKIIAFIHNDADGFLSGAIIQKYFGADNVDFIKCSYNKETNLAEIDYELYDKCIVVDYSFDKQEMEFLHDGFKDDFIWLDHHVSSIKTMQELLSNNDIMGIRNIKHSACFLTWLFFYKEESPQIVLRVEDFDIWKWEFEDTKYISETSRIISDDINKWESLLSDDMFNDAVEAGKQLFALKEVVVDKEYTSGMIYGFNNDEIFGDYIVAIKNHTMYKSHLGNKIVKDYIYQTIDEASNVDVAIIYEFVSTGVSLSIRSIGDVNVSEIAVKLGGGGHKNAAGCLLSYKRFYELFFNSKEE